MICNKNRGSYWQKPHWGMDMRNTVYSCRLYVFLIWKEATWNGSVGVQSLNPKWPEGSFKCTQWAHSRASDSVLGWPKKIPGEAQTAGLQSTFEDLPEKHKVYDIFLCLTDEPERSRYFPLPGEQKDSMKLIYVWRSCSLCVHVSTQC